MSDYVVVVGSMNCDVIYLQERLPVRGETFQAFEAKVVPGGKGANQAVQAAKLGIKTYMVSKVGNDYFGRFLKAELANYGADDSNVFAGCGMTGIAAVHTLPDGVYFSTVAPGANFELTVEEIHSLKDLIRGAKAVIVQNEVTPEATYEVIRIAAESNVYVVYNAAPAKDVPLEILAKTDCLIVNEAEASFYLGSEINSVESAKAKCSQLLQKVKDILIITLGKNGSLLCSREGCTHYPADDTIKAVETTGSGDSYVGAFAYMKALGADNDTACRFASLVSQYTITKVGGQPSMPTLADVEAQWIREKNA